MKRRISPVKALFIGVAAVVLMLAVLIGGAVLYAKNKRKAYFAMTDTRDLKQRIEKLGNEYIQGHGHASLMIAVSTRSNFFFKGFALNPSNAPTQNSIYEIGSITKVFTSLLMAKLEEQNVISSTNLILEILPSGLKAPGSFGQVTLNHLATHTAGLPRLPENLLKLAKDQQNPYQAYGTNELYQALADLQLDKNPGEKLQYSNFGYGLLGHALETRTGKNYAHLVEEQICDPLGLKSTWVHVPQEQTNRWLPGHDSSGQVVPYWEFQVMAAAGALKSTAEDLIRFSRAHLDKEMPLHDLCVKTHKIRFRGLGGVVGWGWHAVRTVEELEFLWHNGGTGGFVSFIGLDPRMGNSVVILSNSGDAMDMDGSVDKMGLELLKLATRISLE